MVHPFHPNLRFWTVSSCFPQIPLQTAFINFFFCVQTIFLRFTISGESLVYLTLHWWCMLAVFMFPTSTHLGYQYQDLLNPFNGIHACRVDPDLYSKLKYFKGVESEPMYIARGNIPSAQQLQGGLGLWFYIPQDSERNTQPICSRLTAHWPSNQ